MRCSIILLLLAGCDPGFDRASYVTGLRVLAVKAEPPELAPGQTATLTPLVVNTRGKPLQYEWAYCLRPPRPGSAVAEECLSPDGGVTTELGRGETMQVTMPELTAEELGVPDFTGGVYLPVVMRVSDGEESIVTVHRLRYTQMIETPIFSGPLQPPNQNPHLSDVLIAFENDAGTKPFEELAIHKGDRIAFRPVMPEEDYEEYPQLEGRLEIPDGGVSLDGGIHFFDGGIEVGGIRLVNVKERLKVSWFATVGRFDPDVTGEVGKLDATLHLDKYLPEAPADIDLYIVVRDDRGGVDWQKRKLLLR